MTSLIKTITPWSTIGFLTYFRTYSRKKEDGSMEDWPDTVERVLQACDKQLHVGFSAEEEDRLRNYMLQLKGLVAGRALWQLGTQTVDRLGSASLQNCAFIKVDHPIVPFTWAMQNFGLGAGVGYSIERKHIEKIGKVNTWFSAPTEVDDFGADFVVPDSLEGWVRLLGKTLKAAFMSVTPDKGTFTYSMGVVRAKGKPIKGFGGVASGAQPLVEGIAEISKILNRRKGGNIRPIDAMDIMNVIATVIVAGNVLGNSSVG